MTSHVCKGTDDVASRPARPWVIQSKVAMGGHVSTEFAMFRSDAAVGGQVTEELPSNGPNSGALTDCLEHVALSGDI